MHNYLHITVMTTILSIVIVFDKSGKLQVGCKIKYRHKQSAKLKFRVSYSQKLSMEILRFNK